MEITGTTKLTGLIGTPVAHSISPMMHNKAFRLLGLDYVYLAFDIAPKDLAHAFDGFRAIGVRGLNVTMPHKRAVIELVDELTPASEICRAANTIINDNGHLIGHTTDGIGFMKSVADAGHDIIGKKMTILGAGGAATAICAQAALDGVSAIDICVRRVKQETIDFCARIRQFTTCEIRIRDLTNPDELRDSISDAAILVNATNVGMSPNTDGCLIPDASYFHPDLIVSDIIYQPRKTKLYRMAEEAGCPVFNGMYMLLFQGAASFKCWVGQDMPVEPIRREYFDNDSLS